METIIESRSVSLTGRVEAKSGETVVHTATSGEYDVEDVLDQKVPEEDGGPFVETSGEEEFADGTDASNIKTATREPFPTT